MALAIARSLHERGVEVIGCDDVGLTVLSFSRHTANSFVHGSFETDEDRALADIEAAVRRYAPDDDRPYVLMPAFRDVRVYSQHRARFEPLIRVAAPEWESIAMVDPKDRFAEFVSERRLSGPQTRALWPHDRRDLPENVRLPLIAKPTDGVGGRGVERIETRRDLLDYLERSDPARPVLLQEIVDGDDYCVSFVAVRGKAVGVVAYRNIAQFPGKTGAGAVRETVDAGPFLTATHALLRETRWNGVAEIDFRWNGEADTPPKMLEVNPRYWAGLFHSIGSGVDFPWLAYQLAAGQPVEWPAPDAVDVGFRSRTPGAWILSVAEDLAQSDPQLVGIAEAWAKCRTRLSHGNLLAALRSLSQTAGRSLQSAGVLARLREGLKAHGDLPSELNSDHDPAVALGVLFALSSLIRHGTLPPELKFAGAKKAFAEKPSRYRLKTHADRTRRPRIGVTKPLERDWFAFQAMRFAIFLAGGRAVKITVRAPRDPHSIDGLLFGGGADIFPGRYDATPKKDYRYNLARDDMEASWADAALRHDIPILGVCRGMQMLNVLAGGALFADLSGFEDRASPATLIHRIVYRVPIRITPASWLARTTGRLDLRVNAIHTQAVDRLGAGFVVAAHESNGLIQAIEHERTAFLVGVQFHPELMIYRSFARKIFRGLVEAARQRAADRG